MMKDTKQLGKNDYETFAEQSPDIVVTYQRW